MLFIESITPLSALLLLIEPLPLVLCGTAIQLFVTCSVLVATIFTFSRCQVIHGNEIQVLLFLWWGNSNTSIGWPLSGKGIQKSLISFAHAIVLLGYLVWIIMVWGKPLASLLGTVCLWGISILWRSTPLVGATDPLKSRPPMCSASVKPFQLKGLSTLHFILFSPGKSSIFQQSLCSPLFQPQTFL